jgi:hypothetical protein
MVQKQGRKIQFDPMQVKLSLLSMSAIVKMSEDIAAAPNLVEEQEIKYRE